MAEAVYLHIPYCKSKCPYCDFMSIPEDASVDAYLEALCEEIGHRASSASIVSTLFIGGGTPTVLDEKRLSRLFERLGASFRMSAEAELTVEANPRTLSHAKMEVIAAGGINRVSLGAQSFVDTELRSLGRTHQSRDIKPAVEAVRGAGVKNLNLDLIFGIPGQTLETWKYSLEMALSLQPEHISTYCLTFEPATPFHSLLAAGQIIKKPDDEELELYEIARETLISAGFDHYEISNFARPGRRCAHNLVYWSNGKYLGLGASAVSYLEGKRITNAREPARYIDLMRLRAGAVEEIEEIPPRMQAIETMIQRLRLKEGIDCNLFEQCFGARPSELFNGSLPELVKAGLLERSETTVRATLAGWRLANEVALKLLP